MGGAKSVDVVRLFGVFEKWKVGKKREDFSIDPCYTGSVESGGNGITSAVGGGSKPPPYG